MSFLPALAPPAFSVPARSAALRLAAPTAPAWPAALLGVAFDSLTLPQAVARIGELIAARKPRYVVTANVDFLVQAQDDVELQHLLLEAELVLCDGTPLLWASRWLGNPLPERVAGADLVPLLLRAAAAHGHRVFLLGAGPGVAATAAARLQQLHPALTIAGHYSPPFRDLLAMDTAEIFRQVQAARPDLLLVSFGCPKQEKWIAMHHQQLGVPVLIGVGATLDFLAGRMQRAPVLMQRTGTEWLFRLLQEPRRLAGRYFADLLRYAPAIARQWWRLRRPARRRAGPLSVTVQRTADGQQLALVGDLDAPALAHERPFFAKAIRAATATRLDLAGVRYLDSTAVAVLLQWHRRLRRQGRQLELLNPSAAVRRTLQVMRLAEHFPIVAEPTGRPPTFATGRAEPVVLPPVAGGHTLAWQGEVTAANAAAVGVLTRDHLITVGSPPRLTHLIDLSRLRYIDSAGVELMGRLRDWARALQLDLRFLSPTPAVRNVLRLARRSDLAGPARP